jgi:hypothetical protein
VGADTPYQYRDPTGLARWLCYSPAAFMVISVLSLIQACVLVWFLGSAHAKALQSQTPPTSTMAIMDISQGILALILLIALPWTAIVYCRWLYRATANARALGANGLETSPSWAVGVYFIPFVNLVMPPRNMGELWRASQNPSDWHEQTGTPLIGWWWASWLIANLASTIAAEIPIFGGRSLGAMQGAAFFQILEFGLNIPAAILLLAIVSRTSNAQAAIAKAMSFS